jgi:hypothetical protein
MSRTRAASVDGTLRALAQELEDEIEGLVETMLPRMRSEVPDFDVDTRPELRDAERASCFGNVHTALGSLRRETVRPEAVPAEALEEARVTARAGVPLESLLHTYRVGHAVVWERAMELLDDMEIDRQARRAALTIGSRYLFGYVDRVCAAVTKEYTSERDRVLRSSIQRRVQLVRDVLSGATIGESELGYDLRVEHVALIASGAELDDLLHHLAQRLDRRLLTLAMTRERTWAWLGGRSELGGTQWRELLALSVPDGVRLAVGGSAAGPEGFRSSHEEALAAHRVAPLLDRAVVRYDEVALEATLLADERAARRFVARELGPLAGTDERAEKLRRTLDAYLSSAQNASAAAAMLGVNDRTVAYRLHTVEELLDRNVAVRSAELSAALRLRRLQD